MTAAFLSSYSAGSKTGDYVFVRSSSGAPDSLGSNWRKLVDQGYRHMHTSRPVNEVEVLVGSVRAVVHWPQP